MTTFWVLFFVSTGAYNGGSVTYYDRQFPTKQACEDIVEQLYDAQDGLWGRATAICVKVEAAE